MDESMPVLTTPRKDGLGALNILEDYLNQNSNHGFCQKIQLTSHARNIVIEKQLVYIIDLNILIEQRRCNTRSFPYDGNETYLDGPVGDIWQDYEFDPPKTTILSTPDLSISRDLEKTRRREECPHNTDDERKRCTLCRGRGRTITCAQLTVKWLTRSMKSVWLTNIPHVIPEEMFFEVTNKRLCLDFDNQWQSTDKNLDHILNTCPDLPHELRTQINHRFLELKRADKTLRLKCRIEQTLLEKVHYQVKNHEDEIFTFYLIGQQRRVHLIESSYPVDSRQCAITCSMM